MQATTTSTLLLDGLAFQSASSLTRCRLSDCGGSGIVLHSLITRTSLHIDRFTMYTSLVMRPSLDGHSVRMVRGGGGQVVKEKNKSQVHSSNAKRIKSNNVECSVAANNSYQYGECVCTREEGLFSFRSHTHKTTHTLTTPTHTVHMSRTRTMFISMAYTCLRGRV